MALMQLIMAVLAGIGRIGRPPAIEEESALRNWLLGVADFLADLADRTAIPADDVAARVLRAILASDDLWAVLYGLVSRADAQPDNLLAGPEDELIVGLADNTAVDPVTIITMVTMVLELIKAWRNRKT